MHPSEKTNRIFFRHLWGVQGSFVVIGLVLVAVDVVVTLGPVDFIAAAIDSLMFGVGVVVVVVVGFVGGG